MTTMELTIPAWVFKRGRNSSRNHTGSPAAARSVLKVVFGYFFALIELALIDECYVKMGKHLEHGSEKKSHALFFENWYILSTLTGAKCLTF